MKREGGERENVTVILVYSEELTGTLYTRISNVGTRAKE